jgi:D-xylose transport system substrate-binding protein
VKCMQAKGNDSGDVALLNGSPTDNNATLFKQGYEKAITDAGYNVSADQSVPDWDNTKAGTIFEQMYTKAGGKFIGVDAANDGLGGAVISVLKRNGEAGKIPVTGQDATDEGLQQVLLGNQCMTVYKAIKKEADAAAALAISLAKGDTAGADKQATGSVDDTETKAKVKSVLLQPQAIFKDNVKDVVADGFTTADKLCTTDALKKACEENGVSG